MRNFRDPAKEAKLSRAIKGHARGVLVLLHQGETASTVIETKEGRRVHEADGHDSRSSPAPRRNIAEAARACHLALSPHLPDASGTTISPPVTLRVAGFDASE